jgi:hypothetical protein
MDGWPATPHQVAELVARRIRERELNPTAVVDCDCCHQNRGPWRAVDPMTGWIVCGTCLAELCRWHRDCESLG